MNTVLPGDITPAIRRRNRILVMILLAAVLAVALGGVLYLQHYGFPTEKSESRYH